MPRTCCIKNCCKGIETGEPFTLFKFPYENPENLKKWIDAVQSYLKSGNPHKKNQYICQDHFDEKSFLKEGTKIWKDGIEVLMPRKKLCLKKNAVPSIFTVRNKCQNRTPLGSNTIMESTQESSVKTTPSVKNEVPVPNESQLVENSSIIQPQSSPVSLTVYERSSDVSAGNSSNIAENQPSIYSPSDLIHDWNCKPSNCFLEKWGMVFLPDGNVSFTYCDDPTHDTSVTRSVIVKSDMSTKLEARGSHVNFPIPENITCFKDITTTLIKVVCLRLCENVSCKDGFFQPKAHSSSVRCKSCQIKKRKQNERERALAKRFLSRIEKNKRGKKKIMEINSPIKNESFLEITKEEINYQTESDETEQTVNYEDFSNLCRTCLGSLDSQTQPARLISDKLNDNQASDVSIANLLKVYTTLEVANEDNKPQSLCWVCLDKLLGFHTFREMSRKNEEILNKAIQLYNLKNNGEQEDICRFMNSEENAIFYQNSDEYGSIKDSIKEEYIDDTDEIYNGVHDYITCNNELQPSEDTKESTDATFINCSIENDDNSLNNHDVSKDNSFNESDGEIDDPDDNVGDDSENDVGVTSDEENARSDDAFINTLLESITQQKYKCEHCDLEFEENNSLINHKNEEHPLSMTKVECKVCGRMIFNAMIDRHMKRHERAYECDICLKKFTLSYNLYRHKKLHSLSKTFMCNKCNKGFYRQDSLNNHLKVHESKEGGAKGSQETQEKEPRKKRSTYSCDICKRVYSSIGGLKRHKAIHGEKKFLCPICGQAFYHNTNLNFHLRTHTGEKPYECTLCKRKFAQKSTLYVHMFQHTGKKPHKCNICGKTFGQVHHLKNHLLSHTGEKPFPCEYCDKRFTIRTACLAHMRAHEGVKPYVCDICESCFYDAGTRSKHKKKAHPEYFLR